MTTQGHPRSERSNDNFVITELLKVNARLTEQLIEMARTLANHQESKVQNTPMESFANIMHVPETEEDAQFAFQTGQLDKEGLEEAMKEIGFYNAEITIPS